ncbi:MAG: hypothetical protein MUE30_15990, partial [Spirosomaceae bacterium]|nr:hypothetical protein [Spirosomataceae bacterium]
MENLLSLQNSLKNSMRTRMTQVLSSIPKNPHSFFFRSLTIFVVRIFNLTLNPSPVRRGTMYCPLLL